jgi:phosphoribosylglycinamide formyltransferase-1
MSAVRIAVLISGSGSNMSAIAEHVSGRDDIEIGVVLSDRPDVTGLERAETSGLSTQVIDWGSFPDRKAFTSAVCDAVEAHGCTFMVLAGFMRILAPEAVERFPGRILNIHPSLLPAFPGAHAVEEALRHGVKVTGVTIHVVDELVDNGPILAQAAVDVLEGDDVETLHARIQEVEHRLYPRVVADFVFGRLEQR